MSHIVRQDTILAAGRSTPKNGAATSELDDAAWLQRQVQQRTDAEIARLLGVNRRTVLRARQRHGIQSPRTGRSRGVTTHTFVNHDTEAVQALAAVPHKSVPIRRIIEMIQHDQTPPSWRMVIGHIAEADRCRQQHDSIGERNAAIALAATATRLALRL